MEIDVLNLLVLSVIKLWFLLSVATFLLSRSRSTAASSLHALLFMVLIGASLLPFLVDRVPGIRLLILPKDVGIHFHWSYGAGPASEFFTLLGSAYLLIVVWLWTRRFMQIRRVHALLRDAKTLAVRSHAELLRDLRARLAIKSQVDLRYSDQIATPLMIGDIRPKILLPRESLLWDQHKVRRFLLHELAHIARGDWFSKQFSYLLTAVFWIAPPAWRALAKLEWLAELSCDDVVIAAEGRRSDYANDLLDVAANRAFVGAIGLIETCSHYERIAAVLDGGRPRCRDSIKFSLHALVFLVILLALAGVQLAHVKTPKHTEFYELQPLVLLDVMEEPLIQNASGDETTPLHHDPVVDEFPLRFPLLIQPDPTTRFEVTAAIDKAWNGTAGDVIQPLVKVIPEYPHKALRRGREGVVEIVFSILPTGETAHIRVHRAQPAGIFDKAAMDAVKQYRFAPPEREIHGVNEIFEFRLLEDAP
jgi:TonB family protein